MSNGPKRPTGPAPRRTADEKALAPTKPLAPVRDLYRHRCRLEITVETETGKVEWMLICNDCPQRALLKRERVEGFHAPPPLPGVTPDEEEP